MPLPPSRLCSLHALPFLLYPPHTRTLPPLPAFLTISQALTPCSFQLHDPPHPQVMSVLLPFLSFRISASPCPPDSAKLSLLASPSLLLLSSPRSSSPPSHASHCFPFPFIPVSRFHPFASSRSLDYSLSSPFIPLLPSCFYPHHGLPHPKSHQSLLCLPLHTLASPRSYPSLFILSPLPIHLMHLLNHLSTFVSPSFSTSSAPHLHLLTFPLFLSSSVPHHLSLYT